MAYFNKRPFISVRCAVVLFCLTIFAPPLYAQTIVLKEKDLSLYQTECDKGDADSCAKLGVLYETGGNVHDEFGQQLAKEDRMAKDKGKAKQYYVKSCDDHSGIGCARLARFYAMKVGRGRYKNLDNEKKMIELRQKSLSLLKSECVKSNALSCEVLGSWYARGIRKEIERDNIKAVHYYEQACNGNMVRGCRALAKYYESGEFIFGGEKITPDLKNTNMYWIKACALGDGFMCWKAGNQFKQGAGVEKNYSKTIDFFTKSCDLKDGFGCSRLGNAYLKGQIVTQDYEKAAKAYQKSCDRKYENGCEKLGRLYIKGQGVPQDYAQANIYFEKACTKNNTAGCLSLGFSYSKGRGVPQDKANALDLYLASCSGNSTGASSGCNNAGEFYEKGISTDIDLAKARKLYDKSCKKGKKKACTNSARLQ